MMNQEIMSFFNLAFQPFTKEIKTEKLLLLPYIKSAFDSLMLLVETRGIGLLTGESGTGKTCLLRLLETKLNKGLYTVHYLCHTSVGVTEFYSHITNSLGLTTGSRRSAMFRAIKERVLSLNKTSNIHPILIIDEADKLSTEVLQEIRLLTNYDYDSLNALTIILCGHESFTDKFGLTVLESLANSITFSISMDPLPKQDTFSYIEQRIQDAGGSNSLFTQNALTLIHQASGGKMRYVNLFTSNSLIKAYYAKSPQVEKEHVEAVIKR
jgi:general secretion pathway protein A